MHPARSPARHVMLACGGGSVSRAMDLLPDPSYRASQDTLNDMLSIEMDSFTRQIVYSVCVFPLIAFTILLTFVLNATTLFGGNIPEIGRGLVKLI